MDNHFILKRLSKLLKTDIFCQDSEGEIQSFSENYEYNPIFVCEELRRKLKKGADMQREPYIFRDEYMVYFACVKQEDFYFMTGPMSIHQLGRVELFHFYKSYGMQTEVEKKLKHFQFAEILDVVEVISGLCGAGEYEDEALIYANHILEDNKKQEEKEKIIFALKEAEEELYHHTYQEERKLLDCVREGKVKEAVLFNRNMDVDLGKLSEKEINHWRNAAIVGITLCTRAAIEGGISPSVAYRLSDFYIQKCDSCKNVEELLGYRNHAVEDLTSRVRKRKMKKSSSNYVEQCRDYIEKNYREKIYLEDIADVLGISTSYLSRLFHAETNIRIQDYITHVRIEHAANLLTYSEESIAGIAEYVNFPSQSYMGRIFKAYKNVTPREYRELHKPNEFTS